MGQTNLSVQELAAHFNATAKQPFPRRLLIEELGHIAEENLEESAAAQRVLVSLLGSTSELDRFDSYRFLKRLRSASLSTPDTDNSMRLFEADTDNEEICS